MGPDNNYYLVKRKVEYDPLRLLENHIYISLITFKEEFNSTMIAGDEKDNVFEFKYLDTEFDGGEGIDTLLVKLLPIDLSIDQTSNSGNYANQYNIKLKNIEFLEFGATSFKTKVPLQLLTSGFVNEQIGYLTDLYLAFFGRAPDVEGLEYWSRLLLDEELKTNNGNKTIKEIASEFAWSKESQNKFPLSLSNKDFIREIYVNCFNREPDLLGWEYWLSKIDIFGEATLSERGKFVFDVLLGAYAQTSGSEDRSYLLNKRDVALHYVSNLSRNSEEDFSDSINTLLSMVNSESLTRDNALNIIDYVFDTPASLTGILMDEVSFNYLWS